MKLKKVLPISMIMICLRLISNSQTFDLALASKLQQTIDSMRTATNVKGISACVFYPGMGTWKGVSGFSNAGTPISSDMEFGIASNTKLFSAVVLLKLAENGIIQLDDSLHSYLPYFNNIDSNITIRQLLNHTSGLYDVSHVPGYADSMLNNPNRIYTAAELMTWAGPPNFPAGTSWEYCNTNYLLAGMIAESATGKAFHHILRDSILTPLQLDSTFMDVHENINVIKAHPWQAGFNNNNIPRTSVNSAAWTAGAMYSTSSEMVQWYHALFNSQVINHNSLSEMTTFVGSGNYGMGIARNVINGRTVWLHGGTIWGGYNSSMMYDTASGAIICVLINQLPAQAFQVSSQLLSILSNFPLSSAHYTTNNQMEIFPNPASNKLKISTANGELFQVKIYNYMGQFIKESGDSLVDISDLTKGIYFIEIKTKKGIIETFKLIKD